MNSVEAIVIGTLFVAVFGLIGAIGARRPLLARLAFREAVRRPLQSAIVIGGLMIGAGAILGPQVWNDSVGDSFAAAANRSWGRVDLTVTAGGSYFSPEVAERIANDPKLKEPVAGVQAGVEAVGSVVDLDRDQARPNVRLIGFDPATQGPFGPYILRDGRRTFGTELGPGEVLISSLLADALEAHVGDRVRIMLEGRSGDLRIAGVAMLEGPGAYGLRPAVFMTLSNAQQLRQTELINVVWITARGEGDAESNAARVALPAVRGVVAATSGGAALEVRDDKAVEGEAYRKVNDLARPFLTITSLFVVAVGAALVINLALTLADERRPRLAVLRALGLTRAGLVALSLIEGAMYSLVAAVAGIIPAALIGWAMFSYAAGFERGAINGREILFEPSIRPATVATSMAAGALITVCILFFASIRTSRMAIASAIRQLPEPAKPQKDSWFRRAAMLGLGLAAAPAIIAGTAPLRLLGGTALIALASMLVRGRLPERARATLGGLAVAFWSLATFAITLSSQHGWDASSTVILLEIAAAGTATSVFGLSFVLAANLRLVERLGDIPGRATAGMRVSLRPALAYLTRQPMRSGLATSAFALVVAMQVVATFNIIATGRADYSATPYDVVVTSIRPPDLTAVQSTVDRELVIPTRIYSGPARARMGRYEPQVAGWRQVTIPLYSLSDDLLREPLARLRSTVGVPPDQAALWDRLRDDPTAVVASIGAPGDVITLKGPRNVDVKLTVLATFGAGFMSGIAASTRALAPFAELPAGITVLLQTSPGTDPASVAAKIRRSLVSEGVDATTTRELLDAGATQFYAANSLIRLLMAMGMLVAVFSLGVLALRAVVERRRAIGVLRAIGYQRRQILAGFLGESAISAGLGIAVGLAAGFVAGLLTVSAADVAPPTLTEQVSALLLIGISVLAVTLAVTAGPAFQASRLAPMEALRVVD